MADYDILSTLKENDELNPDSKYLIVLNFKEDLEEDLTTQELGQAVIDIKRHLHVANFKTDRLWKHDPHTLMIIGETNPIPIIAIGIIAVIVMAIGAYCLTLIDDNIHEIVMSAAPVTRNIAFGLVAAALGGLLFLRR